MKLSQKFLVSLLTFLMLGSLQAGSGCACDAQCQADKYTATAEKATEAHQPVEAIKHYVQALLFNPAHPTAKSSLRKIALSYDSEFLKYRMKVYRIQELLDYISFMKQQISSSSGKNVVLKETFDLDADRDADGLDGIIEYLAHNKRDLVDQFLALQNRPAETVPSDRGKTAIRQTDSPAKENLGFLQIQMDRLRQEVNGLKEGALSSEKRIAELTSQLTQKSLDIYEKDTLIAEQRDGYRSLQNALEEAQERLNLVQRIMQEKDSKIQDMERDVKTLQAFAEQYHTTSDESVQSLRREFAALQKGLIEQVDMSREQIEAMEKRMTSLSIAGQAKGKRIAQMNQALVQKNQKIKQREQIIGWQGQRLVESGGILEIYKDKLHETNQLLKEKIERIRELEKQSAEKEY